MLITTATTVVSLLLIRHSSKRSNVFVSYKIGSLWTHVDFKLFGNVRINTMPLMAPQNAELKILVKLMSTQGFLKIKSKF